MKLLYSSSSPFVRKISVIAKTLALSDHIEHLASAAHPLKRDARITAYNPLGKVPTLITDTGQVLYDSAVIAQYLCSLVPENHVLPDTGPSRWENLRRQALGDGILDAALLVRYELGMRSEDTRCDEWMRAQMDKVHAGLATLEAEASTFATELDLGSISIGCALGYLDFRFKDLNWRENYRGVAGQFDPVLQTPAFVETSPRVATAQG